MAFGRRSVEKGDRHAGVHPGSLETWHQNPGSFPWDAWQFDPPTASPRRVILRAGWQFLVEGGIVGVPTYDEIVNTGWTYGSSGTQVPTTPVATALGNWRNITLNWDRQANLTNLSRYEVQVSADGATWYAPRNDGVDWKGSADPAVGAISGEIYTHTNVPHAGTVTAPTARTLYYRVRRVTKLGVNSSWSVSVTGATVPIGTGDIIAQIITTGKIATGAILTSLLADNAVALGKIAAGAVNSAAIASLAVTAAKIGAAAVTAGKIAASAVTASTIASLAVTSAKVAASAITTSKLATGAVTAGKIAANAVTTTALNALAVTSAKVAAAAIITSKIAAAAVTEALIAANAITAAKIDVSQFLTLGNTGLLWYMPLGEVVGSTTLIDDSPAGVDATVNGTVTLGGLGVSGGCADFGGADTDFVESSGNVAAPGTAWSLSIWIKPDVVTGAARFMCLGDGSNGLLLRRNGTGVEVRWQDSTPTYRTLASTGVVLAAGQWYHVVGTHTGTTTLLYVQAVVVGTDSTYDSKSMGAAHWFLGRAGIAAYEPFDGALDEPRVYNRVLTAAEIKYLTLNPSGAQYTQIDAKRVLTNAIIARHVSAGSIQASKIAAKAVTAAQIAAGAITASELAANAVTAVKILAGSILTSKLAASAVTASKIAALAVQASHIATNSLTAAQIAAGAITASELATNAVTTIKILAGAVNASKILAGAVTAIKIAAGSISASHIVGKTITAAQIATGSITATQIMANTITGAQIAALAIGTSELAANAVTAAKIAAHTITGSLLAAHLITASFIASGAIYASMIAAGTITADRIEQGVIPGRRITVASSDFPDGADWYCDGTADQVQIQAAIDYLVATYGGGTVWLTEGTFNTAATVNLKTGVRLVGSGWSSIMKPATTSFVLITAAGTASTYDLIGSGVEDLKLDADNQVGVNGILATNTSDFAVRNINIANVNNDGVASYGVYIYDAKYPRVVGCRSCPCMYTFRLGTAGGSERILGGEVSDCIVTGYSLKGGNSFVIQYTRGLIVRNCSVVDATSGGSLSGFFVYGDGCKIVGCVVSDVHGGLVEDNSTTFGIYCTGNKGVAENNLVSKAYPLHAFVAATPGAFGVSGNDCTVQGNVAWDNGSRIADGQCENAAMKPKLVGQTGENLLNCTFARSTSFAHSGASSYKLTKTSAAGAGAARARFHDHTDAAAADMADLGAGCAYRLGAWFYIPAASGVLGSEVGLVLDDEDSAETRVACANTYDQWQLVEVERTFSATATGIEAAVDVLTAAALNEYVHVDDIYMIPMGTHNEHGQNFYDTGARTRVQGNSWQTPFPA